MSLSLEVGASRSVAEEYRGSAELAPFEIEHDFGADEMLDAFRWMVTTRRLDEEFIRLQRQGQLGVYPSCRGQEAAQVGGAMALGETDWVFPQYRELGMALVRGVPADSLAHLWRGTWLAMGDPLEHRYALTQITIGTHALQAAGFAMGARFDGSESVVLACFGDGATSTGDVHEAMNFAAVFEAPVIFFVQNNQYAISVPLNRQTKAPTLAHKAIGYGMPGYRVDGNDVLASYAVTKRAVERARRGEGPTFIEAVTYRMEAHTTSDDPSRYRSEEEVEQARARDPVARCQRSLEDAGLLDEAVLSTISADADATAMRLRDSIYDAPHGDPMEVFDHVYVDDTGHYERQRAQLRAELDAGSGAGDA